MYKDIFSENLNCKVGDEVYIYSNTYLTEWKKTKSIITDISTKYIEVKETELRYVEVRKTFSLKGVRRSKFGTDEILILTSDKKREKILDNSMEKANKVISQYNLIKAASMCYCSILFSDEYINELLDINKKFLKTIFKGFTLKNLKENYNISEYIEYIE